MTRSGSHCYGLNTPQSDLDVRGIAIPPKEYFLGYLKHFEQADKFQDSELDACIFDLRKFIELASACNPNVIELLWTDPSDHLFVTPLREKLLAGRDLFLSKKARFTFMGYAIAQLKRIKTHRKWIVDPPTQAPLRSDYGLNHDTAIPRDQLSAVQAEVAKQLDRWNDDPGIDMEQSTKIAIREHLSLYLAELKISNENRFEAAARKLGMEENFIAYLQKEREFNAAKQQWEQFLNWKKTRNVKRAELEAKYHYDTKHGMHLVRLVKMCREILTLGKVIVKRTADRDELLGIRNGEWSYERLVEWADKEEVEIDELYKACTILPHTPKANKIDELCIEIVEASLKG